MYVVYDFRRKQSLSNKFNVLGTAKHINCHVQCDHKSHK